ncbi:cryptochrome/photolyase family protein, partial [Candidatus Saccharibacteria bacterium]|nr:cryptochrome/photolyase family protein [Candidatus Saccharibacteria bacterium]
VFGDNDFVREAISYTEEHFGDNPGENDFVWPTNHAEATKWLNDFVSNRLDDYETYENSINESASWMYRSALSSSLNIGLLSPQQIIDTALDYHAKNPIKLGSLEKFVRNLLGWREFTRGEYLTKTSILKSNNILGSKRRMTQEWYEGGIGLPPFDSMMKKIKQHGYTYHQERRAVAGNLMLLAEIDPKEIHQWFAGMFVDSYEWSTIPEVYGMSHFIDGMFAAEVNIFPSDYILDVSDYDHGDWCDTWDGLYWRFVEKHRDQLKNQTETKDLVTKFDKIDSDKKRVISYRAEDFLNKYTK